MPAGAGINANSDRDIVSTDFSMSNSLNVAFPAPLPVVAEPVEVMFSEPTLNWRISTAVALERHS